MSHPVNTEILETLFEEALEEIGISEDSPFFADAKGMAENMACLLYTSPSPRDKRQSRMPSSA